MSSHRPVMTRRDRVRRRHKIANAAILISLPLCYTLPHTIAVSTLFVQADGNPCRCGFASCKHDKLIAVAQTTSKTSKHAVASGKSNTCVKSCASVRCITWSGPAHACVKHMCCDWGACRCSTCIKSATIGCPSIHSCDKHPRDILRA